MSTTRSFHEKIHFQKLDLTFQQRSLTGKSFGHLSEHIEICLENASSCNRMNPTWNSSELDTTKMSKNCLDYRTYIFFRSWSYGIGNFRKLYHQPARVKVREVRIKCVLTWQSGMANELFKLHCRTPRLLLYLITIVHTQLRNIGNIYHLWIFTVSTR